MSKDHDDSPILVLMGPTASGKSALGMVLAQKLNAVIINADTMQCYADLRTITARPSQEDEATTEHQLYGMWSADEIGSAMRWQEVAITVIQSVIARGKTPLLLGGTGMYLQGLTQGIAPVPPISDEIRQKVRAMASPHPNPLPEGEGTVRDAHLTQGGRSQPSPIGRGCRKAAGEGQGSVAWHMLNQLDPIMASRLKAGDTQRIARALEVMLQTGKSLDYWHQQPTQPIFKPSQFRYAYVDIAREEVYARINWRFDQMMQQGALEEVEELMERLTQSAPLLSSPRKQGEGKENARSSLLDHRSSIIDYRSSIIDYPILKAHGVPELMGYLRGERTLDDAIDKAKQHTRNYAKRQMTWIRNQCAGAGLIAYGIDPASVNEACFLPITSQ